MQINLCTFTFTFIGNKKFKLLFFVKSNPCKYNVCVLRATVYAFVWPVTRQSLCCRYKHDVDKRMVQLKLMREDGVAVGAISWFAVHPTSMNNTNTLVSSDNVGYAAILFEQRMNPGRLIGKVMALAARSGVRPVLLPVTFLPFYDMI